MNQAVSPGEEPDDRSDQVPEDREAGGDAEQANSTPMVGPNLFADNRRRRIPGVLYILLGVVVGAIWLARRGGDPILINTGMAVAALLLILLGGYALVTAWSLDVDEENALRIVAVDAGRPMGHAAAQLGWRGWLSRPTWRILWYSAEDPPLQRGLAFVDAHDGRVIDSMVEDNPEDWTTMDGSLDQDLD